MKLGGRTIARGEGGDKDVSFMILQGGTRSSRCDVRAFVRCPNGMWKECRNVAPRLKIRSE